jgi:hypothetical protein
MLRCVLYVLLTDKFKGATPLSSSHLLGAGHLQPSCAPTSMQARAAVPHTPQAPQWLLLCKPNYKGFTR